MLKKTKYKAMKWSREYYTVDLLVDWFGISCMTTDNFYFYLQNILIQTSQTGGQQYSDTSPFSIPWMEAHRKAAQIHSKGGEAPRSSLISQYYIIKRHLCE
jgi:hypothetical protein